jgi:hypothetical protein
MKKNQLESWFFSIFSFSANVVGAAGVKPATGSG